MWVWKTKKNKLRHKSVTRSQTKRNKIQDYISKYKEMKDKSLNYELAETHSFTVEMIIHFVALRT